MESQSLSAAPQAPPYPCPPPPHYAHPSYPAGFSQPQALSGPAAPPLTGLGHFTDPHMHSYPPMQPPRGYSFAYQHHPANNRCVSRRIVPEKLKLTHRCLPALLTRPDSPLLVGIHLRMLKIKDSRALPAPGLLSLTMRPARW
ncbi:hypothetical protein NUW54_g13464 [Trametes sanguinea]|uniref:Uncharacterized protein n=1 Tax=Trametes sanguinea TaxID=158606 RepID=A0ACC1MKN3_9APHY|nr:hypothetical protein NUW54_g13464 [Trametes sanguinea]